MDDYAVEEEECDCMKMMIPNEQHATESAASDQLDDVCDCAKMAAQPQPEVPTPTNGTVAEPTERDCKLSTSEEQLRSQPFSPLKHCIPKRSLTLPRILVPQSAFGSSGGGAAGSGRSGGGRSGF
uniref:Uncharacterized protein n=1 Tax=Bactrocera dorsalis TaxID=27457 RepID=A0A034WE67_BACDO